jgi:hypothetical protein
MDPILVAEPSNALGHFGSREHIVVDYAFSRFIHPGYHREVAARAAIKIDLL